MSLRDVDAAETVYRLRAAAYATIMGALGFGLGLLLTGSALLALLAAAVCIAVVFFATLFMAEFGGRVGAALYRPSGSSTPAVREYSYAASLVARGQHEQAVTEYDKLASLYPADPEPRLRQARVLRDSLHAYEDAATVFRQVLLMPALKRETEQVVLRELVELYVHRQRQPQRALPYLARIAEKFSGTPTATWARAEAREIKNSMARPDA